MNALRLCAIGSNFLCAASFTARSSEPSNKLVISEGNTIGFATVADAFATLKAQGLTASPGLNGYDLFAEPDYRIDRGAVSGGKFARNILNRNKQGS
jgi:hypothetical protein